MLGWLRGRYLPRISRNAGQAALAFAGALVILGILFSYRAGVASANTLITDCTSSAVLQDAITAGGIVTFNCSSNPATIPITATLSIPASSVTIDGGGQVTLDGLDARRIINTVSGSNLTLKNITLKNGNALDGLGGGGVRVAGTASLIANTAVFTNNKALTGPTFDRGGAIYGVTGSFVDLQNSTIVSNTAGSGGIFVATLSISGSTVLSNSGGNGAGIFAGTAAVTNTNILSNTSSLFGGGITMNGTISGSVIAGNTSANSGGGINATGAPFFLINSTVINNKSTAGSGGGGINTVTATIVSSSILSNTSNASSGGVKSFDLTVSGSTFAGNQAVSAFGGAIVATNARITNSTFARNPAGTPSTIYLVSTLAMTNTTLTSDEANAINGATAITLTNSIVSGIGSPLCSITGTLQGKNVIQDGSCGTGGSLILADPLLGPLQNNGGPTLTMAPQPGSPAIGQASFCLPTDQRGLVRAAPCDIGAFESGSGPLLGGITPKSAFVDDPGFTLVITGSQFLTTTVGLWNGSPRPTVVGSTSIMSVAISSADLSASGIITVAARYGSDDGSTSNSLPFTVTKHSQTIAFVPIADHPFSDAPFAITPTATSGLPVSLAAAGACSVNVFTVTLTALGSCTITATQTGNVAYDAAPSVVRTFTIGKGNQTITFAPLADRALSDPPITITATASSGLEVTFSVGGNCTINGATVTPIALGTCTVTASQTGDASFNAAPNVQRTFNIVTAGPSTSTVFLTAIQVNKEQ